MLGILLMTLKIIGIVLLGLTGLILFLLVIIFFVPICYEVECEKTDGKKEAGSKKDIGSKTESGSKLEGISGKGKVSWLFGGIRVYIEYKNEIAYRVMILFITALQQPIQEKKSKKKKLKNKKLRNKKLKKAKPKQAESKKAQYQKNDKLIENKATIKNDKLVEKKETIKIDKRVMKPESIATEKNKEELKEEIREKLSEEIREKNKEEIREKNKEEIREKNKEEIREKNKEVLKEKPKEKSEKIKEPKKEDASRTKKTKSPNLDKEQPLGAFEQIKSSWKSFQSFRKNEEYKGIIKFVLKNVWKLIKSFKPKKIQLQVIFGTDDPADTGSILAGASMLYALYGRAIQIEPDFEKQRLEGRIYVKGRIFLCVIAFYAIKILIDKRVRKLIKQIKKQRKTQEVV